MRKIIAIIVVFCVLLLGLTACQSSTASGSSSRLIQDETYLVLVNKENEIPDGWLNRVGLVTAYNALGEESQVERVALASFEALRTELQGQGINIELDSVYRSIEEQQAIWDEWLVEYGEDYCNKYLAVPGYSEHHTGLAIDIFIIKDGQIIRENDDMLADTKDFTKIHQLLPKYGFILRYPQGKEDITGYNYEPWHLRFVGPSAAEIISSRGITLEEYLGIMK